MVSKTSSIVGELRQLGYRITMAREALLHILSEANCPLSSDDLRQQLGRRGRIVNRTTVYRELSFLLEKGYVREISLGERKKRYELTSEGHHHHLVCVRCERVEDIPLENELRHTEDSIHRDRGFHVQSHSLEFFGLCARCH